jgi:serine O-acetyltransferase
MTTQDFESKISKTVEYLSDPASYNVVCHEHRLGEPLPSIEKLQKVINMVREILFPGYFGSTSLRPNTTRHYMGVYVDELHELLSEEILAGMCFECQENKPEEVKRHTDKAKEAAMKFIEELPEIRRKLVADVNATYVNDPAARNLGEVIFCYPGIRAITNYRMANKLLELEVPLIPRFIAEMAHSETGIDIHPRAHIGENFTIDHGTGVVIGSTCIIGNNVKIYQGVTLGAKSFPLDDEGKPIKRIPRHPIVEDNVVIYSGATILGRITIGEKSIIGGNVWVTRNIPPQSRIIQTRPRETTFADGSGI